MSESPINSKRMMGEPDYERCFDIHWKHRVENSDGTLDKDKVMRELYDYYLTMVQVKPVYSFITKGKFDSPLTKPEGMIAFIKNLLLTTYKAGYSDGRSGKII